MTGSSSPDGEERGGKIEIERISDIKDSTLNIAGRDVVHIGQVVIGDQASQGLKALERLLVGSPLLKESVIKSRERLEAIKGQIDKIADYKDVHDLLHQLQFSCYNMIRREEKNFPDVATLEILGSYEMNLGTILVRLRAVAARKQIHPSELTWIDEVGAAQSLLQQAIDFANPDRSALTQSMWYLMRTINRFPSLINRSLLLEARALDLGELLKALRSVVPTAEDTSQDVRSVSEFIDGLNAIEEMHRRLTGLTEIHDTWQKLELEFVQFEETLESDAAFLEFSWTQIILPGLSRLEETPDPGSTDSLKTYQDRLSAEITGQNIPRIRGYFQGLRRETGLRFFQVDVNLKALCDELRKVAEPLEGIIYRIAQ